jgi:uncharacterized protein (DUF983 family)
MVSLPDECPYCGAGQVDTSAFEDYYKATKILFSCGAQRNFFATDDQEHTPQWDFVCPSAMRSTKLPSRYEIESFA